MKKLLIITSFIFSYSILFAQDKIVETKFEVRGNCGMCEERIENAALIKGVKKAEWDKKSQTITVLFRSDKVEILEIHKAIAAVGHNTNIIKAKEEDYKKLPFCCAYIENPNIH